MIQKRFVETGVIDIMTDTSHYRLQLKTLNNQRGEQGVAPYAAQGAASGER
jgi:hypothetical protein